MKKAMKLWGALTGIYFAIAVVMFLTLREMDTWYLIYWLMFGVPILLGYFLLVVLYHKGNRKVFRIAVLILILLAVGYYVNETVYEPYKSRQDVIRQQQGSVIFR